MFSDYIDLKQCSSKGDYIKMREYLKDYGIDKFYNEMENKNVFKNECLVEIDNPFVKMIKNLSNKEQEFIDIGSYILITCNYNKKHKLLTPKRLDWKSFNVLTLDKKDLPMLYEMKELSEMIISIFEWKNTCVCFHCFPFNSVQALHLHIVDLSSEPNFHLQNNLSIDDVISTIQEN